jgi:Predicted signal transduction protein with a C-terminal ATPase domain
MIKDYYSNLSIKYKILINFWIIIFIISLSLGYYSFYISRENIKNKMSSANLEIARQIDSSINFLQKDIIDISTFLCIDPSVQSVLRKGYELPSSNEGFLNPSDILVGHSLKFVVNLMASKSYISLVGFYSNDTNFQPYYISNDLAFELKSFSEVQKSMSYKKALSEKGKPVWYLLKDKDQAFIENNTKIQIAIGKIVNDLITNKNIGFLLIGMDEKSFKSTYSNNLHSNKESVAIVDDSGVLLSSTGPEFYNLAVKDQPFIKAAAANKDGYLYDSISGKDMLVAYSSNNYSKWKVYYAVPADALTKGISSIKVVTVVIISACILFTVPIIILISSPLTSPLNKLLNSMKRFQKGNFDEKVEYKYNDEIGELGKGYNNMVAEIKNLVDTVYISQIKERDAELNALQAQINPHFLYNTLDTILMKAEGCKENEIADMIYSLSRLFRLSLNRGKKFIQVAKEKELVEHYLALQKIRFKNKLNYKINIDEDILEYAIPKLILQPFVENSIIHGIESKKSNGVVKITGSKEGGNIRFVIEDNGIGMEKEMLQKLLVPDDTDSNTLQASTGGYAIKNVKDRLELAFKERYRLNFTSEPGKGTKVVIIIPQILDREDPKCLNYL